MKRILSLDGGGIRGVFTLEILSRIEALFREDRGKPDLVLAEVFDLIAGTSTGAIIATFLSWGMPVSHIQREYVERGPQMFARQPWYLRWKAKYRAEAIAEVFRSTFSEDDGTPALLGSKRLKTLLLLVVRNASTGSPWPLTNNPAAMFNEPSRPDCNLALPLWQVLRASTAAPSFFSPQEISFEGRNDLFVDGGMTPYNNPALIAVLMATLPCYRLEWPAARQSIHVISIGTGLARARLPRKVAADINMLDQLKYLAPALISSIGFEQDLLCRVLGDCVHGHVLDREIGDLAAPALLDLEEKKFTYVRYDRALDAETSRLLQQSGIRTEMDNLQLIPLLQEEGREYASKNVAREHLYPRGSVRPD
jgi:patatin-like phospholipase/acyl hydrolase